MASMVESLGARREIPRTDFLAPEVLANPFPYYSQLQAEGPVLWDGQLQSWILTRYEDIRYVLNDADRYISDWRRIGVETPKFMQTLQSLDPPDFTELHTAVTGAIRSVDQEFLQARVADVVAGIERRISGLDRFDFVTDVANPIALASTCIFLGVEMPDPNLVDRLANSVIASMDSGLMPQTWEPGLVARQELTELADLWLESHTSEGIVNGLMSQRRDLYSRIRLANSVRALLLGGYASWGSFLGLAVLTLLQHRRAREYLRHHGVTPVAVHELIRFVSPVQAESRATLGDSEIAGQLIRPGETVIALLAAANHDPKVFDAPNQLRLTRRPNPHFGFGYGIHACLGVPFVHRSTAAVFTRLLGDIDGWSLAGPPVWKRRFIIRSLASLPIKSR